MDLTFTSAFLLSKVLAAAMTNTGKNKQSDGDKAIQRGEATISL